MPEMNPYSHIDEVKEVGSPEQCNQLLSQGWELMNVLSQGDKNIYVLGKNHSYDRVREMYKKDNV